MLRTFLDASIRSKIICGYACLLGPLLTASVIGYRSFDGLSAMFGTYEQRVGVMHLVDDLSRDFVTLRWHVREYALSGADADADAANASATLMSSNLAQDLAGIHDPERHARIEHIAATFEQYRQGVARAISLRHLRDAAIQGAMDMNGAAATTDLAALIAALTQSGQSVLASLTRDGQQRPMEMRLAANKMAGRNDDADATAADHALDMLLDGVSRLDRSVGDSGEIRGALADLRNHDRYCVRELASHTSSDTVYSHGGAQALGPFRRFRLEAESMGSGSPPPLLSAVTLPRWTYETSKDV